MIAPPTRNTLQVSEQRRCTPFWAVDMWAGSVLPGAGPAATPGAVGGGAHRVGGGLNTAVNEWGGGKLAGPMNIV